MDKAIDLTTLLVMFSAAVGAVFLLVCGLVKTLDYLITKVGAYIGLVAYMKEHYVEIRQWVRDRQRKKLTSPLKEVCDKWPGDESIDEILDVLKGGNSERNRNQK